MSGQSLHNGEYIDNDDLFRQKMPQIAECLTVATANTWRLENLSSWYGNLVRDDGLTIGIRQTYGKLEISGKYDEYWLFGEDAAKNEIGSALTTKPFTIAKGIVNRLLPFVEEHTKEVARQLEARAERDRRMNEICDRMVRVSGGRRKRNNMNLDSETFVVEEEFNSVYGSIDFEAKVWGIKDHNIRITIDHLSELQAYEILGLLKTLIEEQNVQIAEEAEQERITAEA